MTESLKKLRDCLETLEKLKGIRRDLKTRLSRDDLDADKEARLADELSSVSHGIKALEEEKTTLAREIAARTQESH